MAIVPLVVVPAFNEAKAIGNVIQEIKALGLELLVVNDGSTDETSRIARDYGVRVLDLPFNRGVGGALRCGFRWAVENGYDAVVQVDADGQHDPRSISDLMRLADESSLDMVIGSRFLKEGDSEFAGIAKRLVIKAMAASVSRRAGQRLTDVTSGFRLIRSPLLEHLSRTLPDYYLGDTYEVAYVSAARGYQIFEVPVPIRLRQHGRSSASRSEAIAMIAKTLIVTLMHLHFDIPKKSAESGNSQI